MRPRICHTFRAGFAKLTRSQTILFHRYFPTKAKIIIDIIYAVNMAAKSTYASRRCSEDGEPTKPSIPAFTAVCTTLGIF